MIWVIIGIVVFAVISLLVAARERFDKKKNSIQQNENYDDLHKHNEDEDAIK